MAGIVAMFSGVGQVRREIFGLFFLCSALFFCTDICGAEEQDERAAFKVHLLQTIADYSYPGIGVDRKTYLPYDHVRIIRENNLTFSRGYYTAASKISPYLIFLLKVFEGRDAYGAISMSATEAEIAYLATYGFSADNQNIALLRMERMLQTILRYLRSEVHPDGVGLQYAAGMLPWLTINRDGTVVRDKDFVPLLDNGLLSWAYAAVLSELSCSDSFYGKKIMQLVRELLCLQDYKPFFDEGKSCFYGEANILTGEGNPEYVLSRLWTEDLLSILWGLFTMPFDDAGQTRVLDSMRMPVAPYVLQKGDEIVAPRGYIASNHELIWTLLYLPYENTALAHLFKNSQFVQTDYALRYRNPGLLCVSYDASGAYVKMGIPDVAEFPEYVQRTDCPSVFATAALFGVDADAGLDWMRSLITRCNLDTLYGPLESLGPEGRADILTADSQYLIATALGGGIKGEIQRYLDTHCLAVGGQSYAIALDALFKSAAKRITTDIQMVIPAPNMSVPIPDVDEAYVYKQRFPQQLGTIELLDHLAESQDDRHGSNVYSPSNKNMRWRLDANGMTVHYDIPKDANKYNRFAWWGTYLGKRRPYLAPYSHLSITLKCAEQPQKFKILLKREDTALVEALEVDTRNEGTIQGDEVTYVFPLKHRVRFVHLPLTYVAFSVDDPIKNKGGRFVGDIVVTSLKIFNQQHYDSHSLSVENAIKDIQQNGAKVHTGYFPRPEAIVGKEMQFMDSGAIGDATEEFSKEEKGLIYLEFENVNLDTGFSGVWTEFCPIALDSDVSYLCFDVKAGSLGTVPDAIRVELKNTGVNQDVIVCSWNVVLKDRRLGCAGWQTFAFPISEAVRDREVSMLNLVYENWIGKQSSGSLEISSPVFVTDLNLVERQREVVTQLFSRTGQNGKISLFNIFSEQKISRSSSVDVWHDKDEQVLRVNAPKGGWFGTSLYPSLILPPQGRICLRVECDPEQYFSGRIECKNDDQIVFSHDFSSHDGMGDLSGNNDILIEIPFTGIPEKSLINYLAISNIRGACRIKDFFYEGTAVSV